MNRRNLIPLIAVCGLLLWIALVAMRKTLRHEAGLVVDPLAGNRNVNGEFPSVPVDSTKSHEHRSSPVLSAQGVLSVRHYLLGQPALFPPDTEKLSTTDRPPLADSLGAEAGNPAQEPHIVLNILDAYRRSFGGYPTGEDNQQVVNALLGANPQMLPFIPRDHPRINSSGEIVDAWGTAFFFHIHGHDSIQVRSAGPDRLLFTDDDIPAGGGESTNPLLAPRQQGG